MFKRKQKDVSESSKHWYQDKYQHVLTQRNLLALFALIALCTSALAMFVMARIAPLKSVDPYLIQIDEKTGMTQRVIPVTRKEYAADEAIDRYFTSTYIRMRESYNFNIMRYNYNVVRLLSSADIYRRFRYMSDVKNEESIAKKLGTYGQRDIKIRSIVYITNPADRRKPDAPTSSKILQARITATEFLPNKADVVSYWVVTVTFEYANLNLNQEEQMINPLGYTVTSYQIQPEIE
ncbi:MAG: virB8 family protein [Rickettsiales bacterium]